MDDHGRVKLKVLDLFSGIGGFSLGLERTGGFETVAFCEIEPFCQKVLKKHWPDTPIYDDVRTLDYDGPVDVITGGYPCQPFSTAGKRRGKEDDRHLWPAMFSLIKKHRPSWVIGENVAGHIGMGLDDVLSDLEGEGYVVRTFIIPACAIDAKHRRDRLWIVANADREHSGASGASEAQTASAAKISAASQQPTLVAKTTSIRQPRPRQFGQPLCSAATENWQASISQSVGQFTFWPIEPGVGRVANGIPRRVDRLKGLGNAVVPQIPEIIGYAILNSIEQ